MEELADLALESVAAGKTPRRRGATTAVVPPADGVRAAGLLASFIPRASSSAPSRAPASGGGGDCPGGVCPA